MELQFYLFEGTTNVSVGDLAFDVLPSQAKFSIGLFSWPWMSIGGNKVEVRLKINPAFKSFERRNNTPTVGVTSFIMSGQYANEPETRSQLVLVDAVTIDDMVEASGRVEYNLEVSTSELVVRFSYFNRSLVYDPSTIKFL